MYHSYVSVGPYRPLTTRVVVIWLGISTLRQQERLVRDAGQGAAEHRANPVYTTDGVHLVFRGETLTYRAVRVRQSDTMQH